METLSLPLPSRKVERIDGLQTLRMIAVLLVAWMHSGQFLQTPLPDLGIFGVDIFFVISGFILSLIVLRSSYKSGMHLSVDFMRRRIVRIFPVYWLFALYPLAHEFHVHDGLVFIPSLLLLPGWRYPSLPTLANFSWTLIFEMFFYLTFGGVLLFASRRRAVHAMLGVLAALVFIGALIDIRHPILIIVMNPILLEFAMGAIAALLYSREGVRPALGYAILILGWALAIFLYFIPRDSSYEMDVLTNHGVMLRGCTWGVAAGLIVLGMVLVSPTMRSQFGKYTVILGNASYSTYLLSGYIFIRCSNQLRAFGTHHVHGWAKAFLFQFSLTGMILIVGLAFYVFIEKPLLRFANRVVPQPPKVQAESQGGI